jgi:oligopeptide transport system substrate-binding protein
MSKANLWRINMKKIISLVLALVLLASCTVVLASCGAPKDDGPQIKVYLGERIYDFDPTDYYVDSNAESVMSLLFEPLFTLNAKGKLELGMAEDYEVDKNERTIVVTLRESYWSDGARVKADDFIYSWCNVLLNPNKANPAATLLYDIENASEIKNGTVSSIYDFGAVATGLYEITIKYREGANYDQLLKNLATVATAPIRQDIATEYASGYWSKLVNSAISNGPFMIGNVNEEDNEFTLVRNTGYYQSPTVVDYDDHVNPGQLVSVLTRFGEQEITYADIESKTVFYMCDASLADRKANASSAKVADDFSTYTYVFNTDNDLFAIKEVRQALSMVIDRNAIIDAITFGKAATGFLPDCIVDTATGKTFRQNALISTSAKVDEAKALLDSVNLSGIDMSFDLTVNDDEESLAIAALVEAAWESLGHGIKVTVVPVGSVSTTLSDGSVILDSEIQTIVKAAARGNRNFDVIAVDWQMFSQDAFVALAAFSTEYSGSGVKLPYLTEKYGSFGGYADED